MSISSTFSFLNQSSEQKCKFSLCILVSPVMVYENLCFYCGILVRRYFMPWFSMTHFCLALYSLGHTLVWFSFISFGFCFHWLTFALVFPQLLFAMVFPQSLFTLLGISFLMVSHALLTLPFVCLGFSLTFSCLIGYWYFLGIGKNDLFQRNIVIKLFLFIDLWLFFLVISFWNIFQKVIVIVVKFKLNYYLCQCASVHNK